MAKKNLLILILITIILTSTAVIAADFDITTAPIKTKITPGTEALYYLTVTNNQKVQDNFRITLNNLDWTIISEPLSDVFSGMRINPGQTKTTLIKINAPLDSQIGEHKLVLQVSSSNNNLTIQNMIAPVVYGSTDLSQYQPSISVTLVGPDNVNPGDNLELKVRVENMNRLDLSNLKIEIKGKIFNAEKSTKLSPLTIISETFKFQVDKYQEPVTDNLIIRFINGNETIKLVQKEIVIGEYAPEFEKEIQETDAFLKQTKKIILTNRGNVKSTQELKLEAGFFERFFITSTPTNDEVDSEKGLIIWKNTLAPKESIEITTTTNYQPVFYFILLLLAIFVVYNIYKSPVTITKKAKIIDMREGEFSRLKVLVNVKNISRKTIEGIRVIDVLPKIAELEKEVSLGTLAPSEVTPHKIEGTVIKWNILSLSPMEERIITYTIKTKVSLIGGLQLPKATAKFEDKRGRKIVCNSEKFIVK